MLRTRSYWTRPQLNLGVRRPTRSTQFTLTHHSVHKAEARRDLTSDLRWGITNALGLTAICFVPATAAYLVGSISGSNEAAGGHSFAGVVLLYAAMAVAAGVIAGLGRPWLKSLFGTVVVGAAMGAAALSILTWSASWRKGEASVGHLISATLGALIGAFLASYFRSRSAQHR